jgi:hypothetical protein
MTKKFDLEERTYQFAKRVVLFCRKLPKILSNTEYAKQLIRSAGSVGAKIQPEKLPSFSASLMEVFKEKPFLPFSAFISLLVLIIYLSWKIKNFLSSRKI